MPISQFLCNMVRREESETPRFTLTLFMLERAQVVLSPPFMTHADAAGARETDGRTDGPGGAVSVSAQT